MLKRVTALVAALILAPALALACEDVETADAHDTANDNGAEHADSCDEALVGDAERGEERFAADCVECHAVIARLMRQLPYDDEEALSAWLDEFLVDHFAPDDQARTDIIEYLLGL